MPWCYPEVWHRSHAVCYVSHPLKSDKFQYNTLGGWVARLIDQASDGPSGPSGWLAGLKLGHSKLFILIFVKLQKNKKNKLKGFLQIILQEIIKKIHTWNIRRLVDETIVPSTHLPRVLCWRLTDFYSVIPSPDLLQALDQHYGSELI